MSDERCDTYGCSLPAGHDGYCVVDFAEQVPARRQETPE